MAFDKKELKECPLRVVIGMSVVFISFYGLGIYARRDFPDGYAFSLLHCLHSDNHLLYL